MQLVFGRLSWERVILVEEEGNGKEEMGKQEKCDSCVDTRRNGTTSLPSPRCECLRGGQGRRGKKRSKQVYDARRKREREEIEEQKQE